jgi:D-alanyl-D-alanine dipeptidase
MKPPIKSLNNPKAMALCALFSFYLLTFNLKANQPQLLEVNPQEGLIIQLEYKTKNNITGKPLYPKNAKAYLHPIALKRLHKALELLRPQGYGIILLDAWRPYIAGARLWNKAIELDLRDYYCPPIDGGHTRGVAVDITLFKLDSPNTKVAMPSEFDQPITYPISTEALKHSTILKNTMNKAGFVRHKKEWWHFNLPNLKQFPMIEENLKGDLPKMNF